MLKNILINSLDNMIVIKLFADGFFNLLVSMNKKHIEPEKIINLYQNEMTNLTIISQLLSNYRINQTDLYSQYNIYVLDILNYYLSEVSFDKTFQVLNIIKHLIRIEHKPNEEHEYPHIIIDR